MIQITAPKRTANLDQLEQLINSPSGKCQRRIEKMLHLWLRLFL